MKNVLVTGATRGLGLAVVDAMTHSGFRLICTGREISEELQHRVQSNEATLQFRAIDLANSSDIYGFVQELHDEFGVFYGLVNNAAVGIEGVLATMHESDISQMIDINVVAPILLAKYLSRRMLTRREGRIVNVTSIIAQTGFHGLSVYAATKAAMEGFTRSLARELGRFQITANSVAPGYMATDMTSGVDAMHLESIVRRSPLGRLVQPAGVAEMIRFLMSDGAIDITGASFTVDAGSTA